MESGQIVGRVEPGGVRSLFPPLLIPEDVLLTDLVPITDETVVIHHQGGRNLADVFHGTVDDIVQGRGTV